MIKIRKMLFEGGQKAFATDGIEIQINKQDPIEVTVPTAADGETIKMLEDGAAAMAENKASQ